MTSPFGGGVRSVIALERFCVAPVHSGPLGRQQVAVDRLADQGVANRVLTGPAIAHEHVLIDAISQCPVDSLRRQVTGEMDEGVVHRARRHRN